jgi:PAS domain S-box-containing protein
MSETKFELPPGWRTGSDSMATLTHTFDWTGTALGPRETWSPSLTLAVTIVMACAFPMALRWGPDFVLIYNDGYRPILGEKHPWAFGRPAREAWAEVWAQLEPGHNAILNGQMHAIFADDILLRIQRYGDQWDDGRFTVSYSPIEDPVAPSGIGGILVTAIENTARVAAETALRASEERYELALGAAGAIGTWDWDIVNDRVIANAKFADIYSVDPGRAAVGEPLAAFVKAIHPEDRERVEREINASMANHEEFSSEHRLVQRDGATLWVFARGRFQYNEVGEPVRLPGAVVDITERQQTQAALTRSEAEFRTFSQAVPNHVWAATPDGQLHWFNDRVYEYSGAKLGELNGVGWVSLVHPDDVTGAAERWGAALLSGETYQTEFRLRRADGMYRWHLARSLPIRDEGGDIVQWIGTNTDIEEQKGTEDVLASLNATLEQRVAEQAAERDRIWQTSQDLLIVVDEDGVFRAANPAWTTVLGWTPKEVIGQSHLAFVHPDDQMNSAAARDQVLDAPLPFFENRYRHKDGGYRAIAWTASADSGLVYASGRDVTAERAAASELLAAQEALRQSQKMDAVGQLTGGIAHDFNNMLAVVIGSLDLLSRRLDGGDPRAQRYVEAAADGARRAALLTQRLLAFSRQQPLQPEPLDPNKLVAGMSDLLRHSIGSDIRLETVLAGGVWRTHADPNQLENVILNLAVNARDAMPEGGRLTIETQNAHLDERYVTSHVGVQPGQYILIAVTDTGAGMPPAVIDKAFDPFFTTKEVGKGTGLGLSQVYGFVKQSGGHVKIYSEPDHGTTIKIYLPRLTGEFAADSPLAEEAPLALGDALDLVLVVEDEPAVRQFSVDALRELGYPVLEADGASAALRLLDAHPEIALLFTDVVMPDMNGARLVEEARRRRPDIKVLFTTGYTRNAVVHNGILDPGVDLIGKPFTLETLAAKLRAVLDAE